MMAEDQPNHDKEHESHETRAERFKASLKRILEKELTPENIDVFADIALGETIALVDAIKRAYTHEFGGEADTAQNAKEREDAAFAFYGLPDIQNVLHAIGEVKDEINGLKKYVASDIPETDAVIIPPRPNGSEAIGSGAGGFEETRHIPRLLTLLYIIEHDFGIGPEGLAIVRGSVTPQMMRREPYVRVDANELERVVYVCDEEGNVSFVFDRNKLHEHNIDPAAIDMNDKDATNQLIAQYPGIGTSLRHSSGWRSRMAALLEKPIPARPEMSEESIPLKKRSEFRTETGERFLPFDIFVEEVRAAYAAYSGTSDISDWYKTEYKKHFGWPSNPDKTKKYRDTGWSGWSRLAGKEKRSFVPYEKCEQEVRAVYRNAKNVGDWYRDEQKNTPIIGHHIRTKHIRIRAGKVGRNL